MSSGSVTYAEVDRIGGTRTDTSKPTTTVLAQCSANGGTMQSHSFVMDGSIVGPLSPSQLGDVYRQVRVATGSHANAPVVCNHAIPLSQQSTTLTSSNDFIHHRMARNCAPRFDPNEVTAFNEFRCKYSGKGLVDGKMVHNPWKEWSGKLASCDGFREYMEISNDVMRDIRDYVYEIAGGDEAKLDREMFTCSVQSLPMYGGY